MEYIVIGIIVIAIATIFFILTVRILKNKKGSIIIKAGISKRLKIKISVNWSNKDKQMYKNKKKGS